MAKVFNTGYSPATHQKQDDYRKILKIHLKITNAIFNKYQLNKWDYGYFYIDMNSGPGIYNGIKGSPLIFMEEMQFLKDNGHPVYAFFIDNNLDSIESLKKLLPENDNIKIIHGDNSQELFKCADMLKNSGKFGLIYSDENGAPAFDLLSKFSNISRFNKMDFLINSNCTVIKRTFHSSKHPNEQTLIEQLKTVNKQFWTIRNPIGKDQWSLMMGSNFQLPKADSVNFHYMYDKRGQQVLNKLNFTARELKELAKTDKTNNKNNYNQMDLF